MIAAGIGALSCLIWVVMIAAWGRFWRVMTLPECREVQADSAPRVAAVVPARNEADVIGPVVRSLLEQDYPGPRRIFVVDDHSTDDTAGAVAQAARDRSDRVTVIPSAPLPEGWTGKMWALAQGVERAAEFSPEYFLFTDADIVHAPDSVASLVAMAEASSLDMISMMVKLRCDSLAERALIPAFVYFFFMLYPPEWVNDRRKKTAAAAGGDILVRADALAKAGGIAAIRGELIDDCALAREIKRNGGIWLGLTNDARSVRRYQGFGGVGRMISRNAFYQLKHSVWLLIGTLLGLGITFLAPPVLVFFGGWAALLGGLAWLLMTLSFWPMVRFYGLSPLWAASLPLVALFYAGATVHSAVQYWMGRGGQWKGRAQDARA
ncbi:MAG: glycosyltransferase [Candidatus Sulfotelmatobacter sp.]